MRYYRNIQQWEISIRWNAQTWLFNGKVKSIPYENKRQIRQLQLKIQGQSKGKKKGMTIQYEIIDKALEKCLSFLKCNGFLHTW